MKQKLFVFILLMVCSLGTLGYLGYAFNKGAPIKEEKPSFYNKSPEEGLREALEYYNVQYPEIVYAQAILETGHFKSNLCINGNNLFGLYNSRKGKYYTFNHWVNSVEAYVKYVQYKYKPPNDYYKFLEELPYAIDKEYINKLKRIVYETNKNTD